MHVIWNIENKQNVESEVHHLDWTLSFKYAQCDRGILSCPLNNFEWKIIKFCIHRYLELGKTCTEKRIDGNRKERHHSECVRMVK